MAHTPEQIRRLRKKLDLTQEGMAHLLEVSVRTVAGWEAGQNKPSRLAKKALDRATSKAERK